jgi:hypothetical protein
MAILIITTMTIIIIITLWLVWIYYKN